ncbi:MAG TPA: DUF2306 domain-containing protein [Gemmatimonadales bacterium]|nr:DUF2306 domain-containing protein [Gemmatimonadales bacterium]
MRTALWILLLLLAAWVASIAVSGIVAPADRSEFMAELFGRLPTAMLFHLGGGAVALVSGAFQVQRRIRTRSVRLHRWLGRAYVMGIVSAAAAALPLALLSQHDWITRTGLTVLALLWLATTLLGLEAILRGDQVSHQRWMVRSYALTVAAIMLRLYMPITVALGIEFDTAYRAVVWLCWVPNLLLVEALGPGIRT